MHQTRKGKQWYFGMKAHVGVDAATKLIRSVAATAANVADSRMLGTLLHGEERYIWGDQAYQGQGVVIAQRPRSHGNGKTKTGRLWTYVRDDRPSTDMTAPAVWFAYSPDRKGERPGQHLKFYRGALQADAYAGFHYLYEGGAIYEVAWWAHARRKFHEIRIAHASPTTTEANKRVAALYALEAEIRGSTPEIRKTTRQARARPFLDSMVSGLKPR